MNPSPTIIELVPVPGTLATSYGLPGKARDDAGRPWKYEKLLSVAAMARKNPEVWTCTPGMADALVRLDAAMKAKGSGGLRLTEVRRLWSFQASERAKYDTWVNAGRPDPGSRGWRAEVMRTTFVAKPGESNHQWGGAIDIDAYALDFPGVPEDAQLGVFWDLAEDYGLRPIIAHPDRGQSECWHFDRLGPLQVVYDLFRAASKKDPAYRQAYALTAFTGCVLAGTYQGDAKLERLVQARLLLAGQFIGSCDGAIGKMTLAGLKAVGVEGVTKSTPASVVLGRLDELGVGLDAIKEA